MKFDESLLYNIKSDYQGIRYSLFDLATWKNGLAFKKIDFSDKGLPVIKIAELNNGISSNTSFTQGDYGEEVFVQWDDLLFSWSGNPQTSIDVFRYRLPDGWLNQHIFKVTANIELVTKDFLYYTLKYLKPYFTQIATNKQTTGLGHVTIADLKRMSVVIPQKGIQEQITSILKAIDDKIEVNSNINENLEQQAQAYFQELFVDNADPEWTTGTISDLGTVVGGSTPSKAKPEYYTETGIAWITPKDLSINKSKFVSHGENDITELGLKNSSAVIMPEGTVLFSSRAPIGYIAIATDEVTTNQGFKSVVPKQEIGTPFVYFFLKNTLPVIEGMASGSTFKEVSGSTMKKVPAVIPDAETLAKFSNFCAPIFAQQRILEEQNQSLAILRDNLLPKLMSGEIDVSDVQL